MKKELKIDVLLRNLKKKFNLSEEEIIDLFKDQEISIPLSAFNKKLGMLESSTLYLKDTLKLSFKEIAKLLNRNYKTIWTSYNKAKIKLKNE